MKLKTINKYYVLGIIPLAILVSTLALILSYPNKWVFYPLLMATVLTIYQVMKKFVFLPRPLAEYKDLKKIKLELPVQYDVEYFSSQDFDKYPFLVRIVEILSPLYLKKDEKLRVVISEKLLNSKSQKFINIAVCRELEKYRTKSQVKITLALVTPLLTVTAFVLWGFITEVDLLDYFNPIIVYFLLPFFMVILLLAYLFLWNQYITRQETKLDMFLTSYFHINDVEKYINEVEELEGGGEKKKYKEFNNYYAGQRIKKLRNLH